MKINFHNLKITRLKTREKHLIIGWEKAGVAGIVKGESALPCGVL